MAVCMSMAAIPAQKRIKRHIRLENGTTVLAELRGDEFGSCWQTRDGRIFTIVPGNDIYKEVSAENLASKANQKRIAASKARAKRTACKVGTRSVSAGEHQPYIGKKKGLIILTQYSDLKFLPDHDAVFYKDFANKEGFTTQYGHNGSVRDYFMAQSNGRFELDFDVVGPVTLPKEYAYYGAHTEDGANDAHPGEMIATACELANEQFDINFADYDWDNDGEVEQVYILFAGRTEASGGNENTIWAHEWNLVETIGAPITLDGVKVNTYACGCELAVTYTYDEENDTYIVTERPDGIATVCHEFAHCLGFPDMYDILYSGLYGMGSWDLMCMGCYNGDPSGTCPPNYTAWERMYAGWLEPMVLDKPTTVKGMKPSSQYGQTFIIYNDNNKNEYYLLENRQPDDFYDSALPGSGLMITHVDYDPTIWKYNIVNTKLDKDNNLGEEYKLLENDHERCTLFRAGNPEDIDYEYTDLYPSNGNNQLTDTSTPAAKLYNVNKAGTLLMGKSITNITQNADGTIDFDFMGGSDTNVVTAVNGVNVMPTMQQDGYYNIEGIYAGKDFNTLEKGVYMSNGKKIIKK